jgi:glucose/arabinose dehydrogenase
MFRTEPLPRIVRAEVPQVACRISAGIAIATLLFSVSVTLASDLPSGFEETLVVTGLTSVTAMEFAPDGRLFVAEQAGRLRVVKDGMVLSTPFLTVPANSFGEQGLLGVAFDPNFTANKHVYVYYTAQATGQNRVSRFTASSANPDVADQDSELVILDDLVNSGGYHNGGAIHFGLDGKLYVAVGDGSNPPNAQSLETLAGKLLRIDPFSFPNVIPPDNPFIGASGARGEIWALGLRNPFTFAVEPGTGKIHINDVGALTWEEINLGQAGANYGWPTCEGMCANPSFVNPIYAYNHGTGAAITGGAFYHGSQFPAEFIGSYFFGDYVNGFIRRLTPENQAVEFASGAQSPVDLKVGPDGNLYYLSVYRGTVYKITFVTTANKNPVAVASASPKSGPAPLQVTFSGAESRDPDGDILRYVWDFSDSSPVQEGSTVSHTYNRDGPFSAVLTVDDGRGGSASATVSIAVGNPPVANITQPIEGATYNAGDTISFEGTATDAEDGTLSSDTFNWTVLFHHLDHTHPFLGPLDGVMNGAFTIPKTGETDSRVWYRIYLTVKDSSGLTTVVTRDVLPNKSTITLETVPSGLQLALDGQPVTTPHSVAGVVGITRTLGAPSPQSLADKGYEYASWSDGGDATHAIETPITNATYTATYREVTSAPPPTTQTFTNTTAISIPDHGNGSPDPSLINVAGMPGTISKVIVTLNGLSHTYPDDIDILLVGPDGQTVLLMSDAGGEFDVDQVPLTFDSETSASLPDSDPISSGTYRPTDYESGDWFSASAPVGPYGSSLSMLNQTSPNGLWQLFLNDDAAVDFGVIAGGWELTITTN